MPMWWGLPLWRSVTEPPTSTTSWRVRYPARSFGRSGPPSRGRSRLGVGCAERGCGAVAVCCRPRRNGRAVLGAASWWWPALFGHELLEALVEALDLAAGLGMIGPLVARGG